MAIDIKNRDLLDLDLYIKWVFSVLKHNPQILTQGKEASSTSNSNLKVAK